MRGRGTDSARSGSNEVAVKLVGSITHLRETDRNAHVVTGSHGGAIVAEYALAAGVLSLICHDAGVGLDGAGIAALRVLDRHGVAAAAVGHHSAKIGDAQDMWRRGVVSFANEAARAAGVLPSQDCAHAASLLADSCRGAGHVVRASSASQPCRLSLGYLPSPLFQAPVEVVCLDSASQISAADAGKVVLTGSHGGLPAGDSANAIKAAVRLAAFNDAGIGREESGVTRLAVLDHLNIPAFTVSAMSARIGDGRSTYRTGVVSRANSVAERIGIEPGDLVQELFGAPVEVQMLTISDTRFHSVAKRDQSK